MNAVTGERDPAATPAAADRPRIVVLSQLYPRPSQPGAGSFVRERMSRVGRHLPVTVVSPVPWFPLQGLLRRWRPYFRPPAPRHEHRDGIDVYFPRYFSIPGLAKRLDGWLMALGCRARFRRLRREDRCDLIDAHFAYPDGGAAARLGRWLRVPVTVTLRGTETRLVRRAWSRRAVSAALADASRVFAVSESLRAVALELGVEPERAEVVANGVDTSRFFRVDRAGARRDLGIPPDAPVIISVGTLVERKGFHRVIDILPTLRERFPGIVYLVVGGAGPEGDWESELRARAAERGVGEAVRFLGAMAPDALREPLSAADVFVLATRNEGWANVFLEAMACGLPVVTTDVGGNREVVAHEGLGRIVPFGDPDALAEAVAEALATDWDRAAIVAHARANGWDDRVERLYRRFRELGPAADRHGGATRPGPAGPGVAAGAGEQSE